MKIENPTIIIETFKHQGVNKASIRHRHKVEFFDFKDTVACQDLVVLEYSAKTRAIHPALIPWANENKDYYWDWYDEDLIVLCSKSDLKLSLTE